MALRSEQQRLSVTFGFQKDTHQIDSATSAGAVLVSVRGGVAFVIADSPTRMVRTTRSTCGAENSTSCADSLGRERLTSMFLSLFGATAPFPKHANVPIPNTPAFTWESLRLN